MKSFIKYTALGALSLGVAGMAIGTPAMAAKDHHGQRGAMSFEKMDANSDGFITPEDTEARKLAKFTEQDVNGDGFLTLDELLASATKRFEGRDRQPDMEQVQDRTERMLRYLDENGDGKVAIGELPDRGPGMDRMVERFDTDKDGKISMAEFESVKGKFRKGGHGGRGEHRAD